MFSGRHTLYCRIPALALIALVVSCPYAFSVPWNALYRYFTSGLGTMQLMESPLESQSWYIVFGTSVLLMVLPFALKKPAPFQIYHWLAIAYFCRILTRYLFVSPPFEINVAILMQAAFFFIYFTVQIIALPANFLLRASYLLVVSTIPLSVIALLQKLGLDPLPYSRYFAATGDAITGKFEVASTFGHPNYMGSYLAPVLVLAIALLKNASGWILRSILTFSIILEGMAILAAGARASMLSLVIGISVLLIGMHRGFRPKTALLYGILFLLLAFTAIPVLYSDGQLTERLLSTREITSRAFYWQVGLEMWKSHPITGVGLHQFDTYFWETIRTFPAAQEGGPWHFALSRIVRGISPGHLHNDHLQVLVENGIIGAILWGSLWITTYQTARHKSANLAISPLATAFPAILAAALIDALFGFPFQLPCSGLLIWFLLAMWHRELNL